MAVRSFAPPDVGDIVWCWFPHEGFAKPGPKPRPALVIDVGALRGAPAVEVIYGTSQKLAALYPNVKGEYLDDDTPASGEKIREEQSLMWSEPDSGARDLKAASAVAVE